MNAHEALAVVLGIATFVVEGGILTVYAVWAHHGYRSVRPKQRKEPKP